MTRAMRNSSLAAQKLKPNLNRTIKDSYFSSASATPGAVFPRLMRLSQHHVDKLEGGLRVHREKLIEEIMSPLEEFPSHFPLDKQGLFHIAYYHQRQAFFEKKDRGQPETDQQPLTQETTQ